MNGKVYHVIMQVPFAFILKIYQKYDIRIRSDGKQIQFEYGISKANCDNSRAIVFKICLWKLKIFGQRKHFSQNKYEQIEQN